MTTVPSSTAWWPKHGGESTRGGGATPDLPFNGESRCGDNAVSTSALTGRGTRVERGDRDVSSPTGNGARRGRGARSDTRPGPRNAAPPHRSAPATRSPPCGAHRHPRRTDSCSRALHAEPPAGADGWRCYPAQRARTRSHTSPLRLVRTQHPRHGHAACRPPPPPPMARPSCVSRHAWDLRMRTRMCGSAQRASYRQHWGGGGAGCRLHVVSTLQHHCAVPPTPTRRQQRRVRRALHHRHTNLDRIATGGGRRASSPRAAVKSHPLTPTRPRSRRRPQGGGGTRARQRPAGRAPHLFSNRWHGGAPAPRHDDQTVWQCTLRHRHIRARARTHAHEQAIRPAAPRTSSMGCRPLRFRTSVRAPASSSTRAT
jgi:hypothetical protein